MVFSDRPTIRSNRISRWVIALRLPRFAATTRMTVLFVPGKRISPPKTRQVSGPDCEGTVSSTPLLPLAQLSLVGSCGNDGGLPVRLMEKGGILGASCAGGC